MRGLVLIGVLAVLAGCGESKPPLSASHVALAKACVDGGGTPDLCECQATKVDGLLEQGLITEEVQRALLLQEQGKEDEAEAIMVTLSPEDLFNQPSLIAEARLECHAPS